MHIMYACYCAKIRCFPAFIYVQNGRILTSVLDAHIWTIRTCILRRIIGIIMYQSDISSVALYSNHIDFFIFWRLFRFQKYVIPRIVLINHFTETGENYGKDFKRLLRFSLCMYGRHASRTHKRDAGADTSVQRVD